ncbi:MAG: nucleoside hydrolase [Haloarculaceae archaeon]
MLDAAPDRTTRLERLDPPDGAMTALLDTDAYNEVDDQFAIADLVCSRHRVAALTAAPFDNDRSEGPGDGMEQSYDEIERVLATLEADRPVARGATRFMDGPSTGTDDRSTAGGGPLESGAGGDPADTMANETGEGPAAPVESEASEEIVHRAHATDGPLYVVAIGAATNVAAALCADPTIADEIVVVWLGGTPHEWPAATEFNLSQDVAAARALFDSGVPLIHVPTINVAEHVRTTVPELRHLLTDAGIGGFLRDRVEAYEGADRRAWSKVIWDLAATAVLTVPDAVETALAPSPTLTGEETWNVDQARHRVRVVRRVDRDAVFDAFCSRLPGEAVR